MPAQVSYLIFRSTVHRCHFVEGGPALLSVKKIPSDSRWSQRGSRKEEEPRTEGPRSSRGRRASIQAGWQEPEGPGLEEPESAEEPVEP